MQRTKRYLWLSIFTALAAVITLLACWILPGYIPPAWSSARPANVSLGYESYLIPGSPNLNYIKCTATFDPQGEGVYASTKVTITVADKQFTDVPAGLGVHGTRDGAILRLRTDYAGACVQAGYPEAATLFGDATLFDPIRSGPTQTATITYPERARAAFLMSLRPYALVSAWCALAVSFFSAVFLSVRLVSARRREHANHCRSCGYSLVGLATNLCPECGRDAHDDRLRRARRAGRTRTIIGATLGLLGIAFAVLWQDSVRHRAEPVQLFNRTAPDRLTGQHLSLNQGGLHIGIFDATNMRTRALVTPVDDEPYEIPARRNWIIDWSIWRYTADTSWTIHRTLWFSFWPLSLLALSAGIWFIWSGQCARRFANTSTPPKSQSPKAFVRNWLAATAILSTLALACLLHRVESSWTDNFNRNPRNTPVPSGNPDQGDARATTVSFDRASPLLNIRTLSTTWFPSQPTVTVLTPLIQERAFVDFGQLNYSSYTIPAERRQMLLGKPNTPKTTLHPQPGLIILPLSALLLANPLAAIAAMFRDRLRRAR